MKTVLLLIAMAVSMLAQPSMSTRPGRPAPSRTPDGITFSGKPGATRLLVDGKKDPNNIPEETALRLVLGMIHNKYVITNGTLASSLTTPTSVADVTKISAFNQMKLTPADTAAVISAAGSMHDFFEKEKNKATATGVDPDSFSKNSITPNLISHMSPTGWQAFHDYVKEQKSQMKIVQVTMDTTPTKGKK